MALRFVPKDGPVQAPTPKPSLPELREMVEAPKSAKAKKTPPPFRSTALGTVQRMIDKAERKGTKGYPVKGPHSTQISVRIPNDLLEKMQADGSGWQTRLVNILRAAFE